MEAEVRVHTIQRDNGIKINMYTQTSMSIPLNWSYCYMFAIAAMFFDLRLVIGFWVKCVHWIERCCQSDGEFVCVCSHSNKRALRVENTPNNLIIDNEIWLSAWMVADERNKKYGSIHQVWRIAVHEFSYKIQRTTEKMQVNCANWLVAFRIVAVPNPNALNRWLWLIYVFGMRAALMTLSDIDVIIAIVAIVAIA